MSSFPFHGVGASIVKFPRNVVIVVDFLHLLGCCLHAQTSAVNLGQFLGKVWIGTIMVAVVAVGFVRARREQAREGRLSANLLPASPPFSY